MVEVRTTQMERGVAPVGDIRPESVGFWSPPSGYLSSGGLERPGEP